MAQSIDVSHISCPAPRRDHAQVQLGHGSGGTLTAELIRQVFLGGVAPAGGPLEDAAVLPLTAPAATGGLPPGQEPLRLAFTTDAFVVQPLFFPGGNIGDLAVHGTINDLAVSGAQPLYLSAAFILEEGLAIADLQRIVDSMHRACAAAGVPLVTGDTKVVDRGKGDGVFITTSGVGVVPVGCRLSIAAAQPGDRLVVSGTLGDHGITIMSTREGIEFETQLTSDTAALHELTASMLAACPSIRAMRDPTRGGLASALNELAAASGVGVVIEEAAIPLRPEVRAACEMLGLDPLYVANEGKLIAVVPEDAVERLLATMRAHPLGYQAAVIGTVVAEHPGVVVQRSLIGGLRMVNMLAGEQLPRIC